MVVTVTVMVMGSVQLLALQPERIVPPIPIPRVGDVMMHSSHKCYTCVTLAI